MVNADEQYRRVLEIGTELLGLLQAPLSGESLGRVEQLTAERQALADSTTAMVKEVRAESGTIDLLQQVLVQQRVLEDAMRRALGSIRQSRLESQRAMSSVQEMHRLLSAGTRSRHLDKMR